MLDIEREYRTPTRDVQSMIALPQKTRVLPRRNTSEPRVKHQNFPPWIHQSHFTECCLSRDKYTTATGDEYSRSLSNRYNPSAPRDDSVVLGGKIHLSLRTSNCLKNHCQALLSTVASWHLFELMSVRFTRRTLVKHVTMAGTGSRTLYFYDPQSGRRCIGLANGARRLVHL